MAVNIPSGLQSSGARVIRHAWLKRIFDDVSTVSPDVARVSSRLNCSDTEEAIPVWAGTYEISEIEKTQGFKADDIRFGRTNRSKIYTETINEKTGDILEKDWTQGFIEKEHGEYGPAQALGPRAGCMYQLYIAIRIREGSRYRHVGTITMGFRNKPGRTKVDPIMQRWAREDEGSDYVKYLKDEFNLGGPFC